MSGPSKKSKKPSKRTKGTESDSDDSDSYFTPIGSLAEIPTPSVSARKKRGMTSAHSENKLFDQRASTELETPKPIKKQEKEKTYAPFVPRTSGQRLSQEPQTSKSTGRQELETASFYQEPSSEPHTSFPSQRPPTGPGPGPSPESDLEPKSKPLELETPKPIIKQEGEKSYTPIVPRISGQRLAREPETFKPKQELGKASVIPDSAIFDLKPSSEPHTSSAPQRPSTGSGPGPGPGPGPRPKSELEPKSKPLELETPNPINKQEKEKTYAPTVPRSFGQRLSQEPETFKPIGRQELEKASVKPDSQTFDLKPTSEPHTSSAPQGPSTGPRSESELVPESMSLEEIIVAPIPTPIPLQKQSEPDESILEKPLERQSSKSRISFQFLQKKSSKPANGPTRKQDVPVSFKEPPRLPVVRAALNFIRKEDSSHRSNRFPDRRIINWPESGCIHIPLRPPGSTRSDSNLEENQENKENREEH